MENFIKIFYDPFRGFKDIEVNFKNKEELVSAIEDFGEQLFYVKFDSGVKSPKTGRSISKFSMAGVAIIVSPNQLGSSINNFIYYV